MSKFIHCKVGMKELNPIMMSTVKSLFSLYGLLMLIVPALVGGGLLTLIMQRITMNQLGYFIIQPAMLAFYLMMVMTRSRLGEPRPGIIKEVRNMVLTIATGLITTIVLLAILWCFRVYVPVAQAAEMATTPVPAPSLLEPIASAPVSTIASSFATFQFYYNMYSIAILTIFFVMPMPLMFIAALVRCQHVWGNLTAISLAIFRNVSILMALSVIAVCFTAAWAILSLDNYWLVLSSVLPIAFLSGVLYRITQLALPQIND